MSASKDGPDDEIYNTMETDLNRSNIKSSFTKVRYVRLWFEIQLNGQIREVIIELTSGAGTTKNMCDDLRLICEKYLRETCIDVQPSLF